MARLLETVSCDQENPNDGGRQGERGKENSHGRKEEKMIVTGWQ